MSFSSQFPPAPETITLLISIQKFPFKIVFNCLWLFNTYFYRVLILPFRFREARISSSAHAHTIRIIEVSYEFQTLS